LFSEKERLRPVEAGIPGTRRQGARQNGLQIAGKHGPGSVIFGEQEAMTEIKFGQSL
jgi:hypothetical protein